MAGSVLLKQRSEKMDATSSVLGIMLKTKSIEVCHFEQRTFIHLSYTSCISYPPKTNHLVKCIILLSFSFCIK